MNKREIDIEREWRRLEREELFNNFVVPLFWFCAGGGSLWVLYIYFPTAARVIGALISAIALPFAMWLGKKR